MRILLLLSCAALSVGAATRTVKTSGGDHATIQECVNVIANGDTCVVYAGTYPEHVTIPAGGAGAYKTIQANGTDLVYVLDVTVNSHNKVVGLHIENPSSPSSSDCIAINDAATDIYITSNTFTACGLHAMIGTWSGYTHSYVYIQGNTFSHGCSVTGGQCAAIALTGDYHLIDNNDISHVSDGITLFGSYNIVRNNVFHDAIESECISGDNNCHIDFFQSEPSTATQHTLIEGNRLLNNSGPNNHGYLFQGEGCGGACYGVILRYNSGGHVGSGGVIDDNNGSRAVPGFHTVKIYNNSWVEFNAAPEARVIGTGTIGITNNSTNGAVINNLFYYPASLTEFYPYSIDNTTSGTFSARSNLAWCTGTCDMRGRVYGSANTFALDAPGNLVVDPQFVNYAGNNFQLASNSPAIGAGSYLTSVATADTGSGTSLIVDDAAYFSDGYGLVSADWIRVGASATAQIASINYATNTITLASPITRNDGDPVYLYKNSTGTVVFAGTSPDIGAYPYVAPAGNGAPPTKVSVRIVW